MMTAEDNRRRRPKTRRRTTAGKTAIVDKPAPKDGAGPWSTAQRTIVDDTEERGGPLSMEKGHRFLYNHSGIEFMDPK
jgi:hypothetical protein